MTATGLSIWTIYDHPNDFPETFVARRWEGEVATDDIMICTDIEPIREEMRRHGLVCLPREEGDDPKIVENWL